MAGESAATHACGNRGEEQSSDLMIGIPGTMASSPARFRPVSGRCLGVAAGWSLVFRAGESFPHDPAITEAEGESSVGGAEPGAVKVHFNGAWSCVAKLLPQGPNALCLCAHVPLPVM